LPSARLWERSNRVMPRIVGSLAITRSGYGLIAVLPFLASRYLPEATVAVLVAMTVPSVFFSTGWSPMLAEVVPARNRATVLAVRSILSSGTIAVMTFLAGRWLDSRAFPGNYQWLYAVGLIGGMVSVWLVSRVQCDQPDDTEAAERPKTSWRAMFRTAAQESRPFLKLIGNTLVFNLGAWMVMPLYVIFFVRQLSATDSWLGLNTTLAHVGVVVGYWVWRRIVRRIGEHRALLIALPLATIYPFLIGTVQQLWFILIASFLINVINPGVNLSHSMLYLEQLPRDRRHSWNAVYSMVMNIGAFACPLFGVALSEWIGLVPTLYIGGAMRLLGAGMFYLFPIGGETPKLHWPWHRPQGRAA